MKHLQIPALLVMLLCAPAFAGAEGWLIDFEAAKKKAVEEKKDLLVDFTGTDWCIYCIRLSEEVFKQESFKEGAKDSFVFVELDFPNDETKLSAETKAQNEKLMNHYGIEGFPTIILMDETGRPYARTGYRAGGPEQYLVHLNELRQVRKKRDDAFGKAVNLSGVEKARALQEVLALLPPQDVASSYQGVIDEIIASDPEDETGFAAERAYKTAVSDYEKSVQELFSAGKFDEAVEAADAFLEKHNPEGFARQNILMTKVMAHVEKREGEAAARQLEEIKALDPTSEIGLQIEQIKAGIAEYLRQGASAEEGSNE